VAVQLPNPPPAAPRRTARPVRVGFVFCDPTGDRPRERGSLPGPAPWVWM